MNVHSLIFVFTSLLFAKEVLSASIVFEEQPGEIQESFQEFHEKQRNCWDKGKLYFNTTDE